MTPAYPVSGSPGAIVAKAGSMRTHGTGFTKVADGLDSITTDGWASKSAGMFREQFQPESGRWRDSGAGFITAASALEAYAGQLQSAQDKAGWCRQEWDRGEQASVSARAAYDADVARGKQDKAAFEAQGGTYTLTIVPFDDPGTAIKNGADDAYSSLRSTLDGHAHTCADQVRAGCAAAPESRNWFETGLAFVGDVFVGIYEGVKGLVELAMMPITMLNEMLADLTKLATGELTPEELAMKYQLKLEDAKALLDAFLDDPLGFAKQIGKAVLDWDTWADNPAKAIGHLVPDILLAVATLGAGTAASATEKGATGAVKGAEALDDLAGAATKLDNVADAAGAATKLDDVADLSKQLSTQESYATGWYTGSGYDEINSFERGTSPTFGGPHSTTELAKISDNLSAALGKQPAYEGVTYRGTSLPQQVLDDIDKTGRLSDPAFLSSSKSQTVAENFAQGQVNGNAIIEITGKSGRDVSGLSTMGPGQAEVLFDKGTTFDVVSKTWDSSLGMWRIVVKE